jgi:hypothetical protein
MYPKLFNASTSSLPPNHKCEKNTQLPEAQRDIVEVGIQDPKMSHFFSIIIMKQFRQPLFSFNVNFSQGVRQWKKQNQRFFLHLLE